MLPAMWTRHAACQWTATSTAFSTTQATPPNRHPEIVYGIKHQFSYPVGTSPTLDATGITRVQQFVSALLYYARAVDNKLLVALSALGS